MAKWILAAGAAALALTAPALAGPDKGKGGGKAEHGGGHKAERGNGGQKADKGNSGGFKAEHKAQRFDRSEHKAAKFERSDKRDDKREARNFDRRDDRKRDDNRRFADNDRDFRGFANCPPGLAKKNNGCLPPGQAKKLIGAALPAALGSQMLSGPFSQWYRDNDQYMFRNDGEYIYRVNRQGGLIDALFPFQDRDYSYYNVGSAYPADYNFYNVPQQYQSFYADNNDFNYRYGDGAIYQVDRSNNMISSIVALLAGDLGVGQQLPSTYSTYNVPMSYRDRYYDTPDAQYRYNDGFIYRADPKTQLITAVIDALV